MMTISYSCNKNSYPLIKNYNKMISIEEYLNGIENQYIRGFSKYFGPEVYLDFRFIEKTKLGKIIILPDPFETNYLGTNKIEFQEHMNFVVNKKEFKKYIRCKKNIFDMIDI